MMQYPPLSVLILSLVYLKHFRNLPRENKILPRRNIYLKQINE